jgi:hypothetical protein
MTFSFGEKHKENAYWIITLTLQQGHTSKRLAFPPSFPPKDLKNYDVSLAGLLAHFSALLPSRYKETVA